MGKMKWRIIGVLAAVIIAGGGYALGASGVLAPQKSSAAPVLYSQDTVTSVYDKASPAVVEIDVTETSSGFFGGTTEGQGSGILVDSQGHILTNNHVVDGAQTVKVKVGNNAAVDAKVVGTDALDDLAVISVDVSAVSGIAPLQFADSAAVKPGQLAIAIGNPYGLDDSVTVGVISGLDRSIGNLTGLLQTDAAINPGNSGGPLLDANGNVIGINTAVEATATGARGIGFAVSSNTAQKALPDLLAGKTVSRPWLGISGATLTSSLAQELGLSVTGGVYVISVSDGSPAAQAGLKGGNLDASGAPAKGGDVITAVDGKSISAIEDLTSYIRTKAVGDRITLSVTRDGGSISVTATLEAWPANLNTRQVPSIPQPTPFPRIPRRTTTPNN